MEMISFVFIVVTSIMLLQIKYFQKYKKLINRITASAIVTWLVALIVYGTISGRTQTNLIVLKRNYPIYLIIFVIAITIEFIISRNSNKNKDDLDKRN
ncbi:hypothetical protein D3C87_955320 [compost metagenome]